MGVVSKFGLLIIVDTLHHTEHGAKEIRLKFYLDHAGVILCYTGLLCVCR